VCAQSIDLSGVWRFKVDREATGIAEKWYAKTLDDSILLPASMPERLKGDIPSLTTKWTGSIYDSSFFFYPRLEKYRQPGNVKFSFFLTPDRHYVGVAWYQRDIEIPAAWKGRKITLLLERPHIESRVWIDKKELGMQNSLSVPHIFDLSAAAPGKHTISIAVDNRIKDINVGIDSHSITDQTQGNWNGIVGKMELRVQDEIFFDDIQVFPKLSDNSAVVKMAVKSLKNVPYKGAIRLQAKSFNSPKTHETSTVTVPFSISQGEGVVEATLPFGSDMLTWDEFDPALYMLEAQLESGKLKDTRKVQFGMREFSIKGVYFYVNGRKTMLRGTVENCLFPRTGYAPMNVEEWQRVFAVARSFGLNHVRFHSFCPPEAAFIAADLAGFYLQPEGPSWPNHSTTLGDGKPSDKYIMDETVAQSKAYGNYASFCMLALGNEPAGRHWVRWAGDFVDYWKATDGRRVYTGASVGGGWAWQPRSQYHVKAGARGLSWERRPESYSTYSPRIDTVRQPYVSHETGQWCVFPNFDEIRKYTGVNKPRNFELFKEDLADHDMGDLGRLFMMASGKLQALCYKHEIEKTLRTPGYAGFQLLALNDYSGQGTALVGVTDVFWDEKEYITAAEFRKFCNATVLLAKMRKFVFAGTDTVEAEIETAHFGREPLKSASIGWKIKDVKLNRVVAEGTLHADEIPIGNGNTVGKIRFVPDVRTAARLNLEVSIKGTEVANDWDFWVYPALPAAADAGKVYVTDTLDGKALGILHKGGNVLLLAAGKVSYGKSVAQRMTPVFWNTSWFKMRPPHTTGLLINPSHRIFDLFPTEYHSQLQWWELVHGAQAMLLSDFPKGFQPIIQPIDTWFLNRKLGMLLEAKVNGGKLVMCSADLTKNPDERIVARQLLESILRYMNSDYFRPQHEVEAAKISDIFTKAEPPLSTFTVQSPMDLIPK
jgi:hypothetical protein